MGKVIIKISSQFLVGMVLCACATPAYTLSMYTRGSKSPVNSPSQHRYSYANPFYQKRATPPKLQCKAIGQARCLTPSKKPNPFVLTRQNPAMQQPPAVHPYVRKVFKTSIQRIN